MVAGLQKQKLANLMGRHVVWMVRHEKKVDPVFACRGLDVLNAWRARRTARKPGIIASVIRIGRMEMSDYARKTVNAAHGAQILGVG